MRKLSQAVKWAKRKTFGSLRKKDKISYFKEYLDFLGEENLYPNIAEVDGPSFNPTVAVKGVNYLSFTSNNYLGLAGNEEAKEATKKGIDKYGIGSGSTRLLAGTLEVQNRFERKLAEFFGMDDAITFSSGYLANVGVIRMLVDSFPYFQLGSEKEGLILSDQLNHASIIDGVRLSSAVRVKYAHSNMSDLEKLLEENKSVSRKLIITDGIFSMDGDLARLPDIVELAKKHGALVFVDDSHGVGVLGPNGEGVAAHMGVAGDIDVLMGSFTKAFGSIGGFVSVKKPLGEYLRITARSFIFSDPIPPAFVEGLITTLELIKKGDKLRKTALESARYLRTKLRELGFVVHGEDSTIVPLIIREEKLAIDFSRRLMEQGIMVPCIRRPAVDKGKERLRFSVTALHDKKQIDLLLDRCGVLGRELGMIK